MEKAHAVKPSKNKADLVEKNGKNKRISDFFTTPDKNLDKQRQKSLLQFFTKSASKDKPFVETTLDAVDPAKDKVILINDADGVTTPNNSDKENSESVVETELLTENNENSNKSKKKQLFPQNSGCSDKVKTDKVVKKKSLKDVDSVDLKKNKKNKKKKAKKAGEDIDSLSDSVILLSDSSLSGDQFASGSKESSGMSESVVLKSQPGDNLASSKLGTDLKQVEKDEKMADSRDNPLKCTDSEVNKKGSSYENTEAKVKRLVQEETDHNTDLTADQKDGGLPKCKKTALKGKDMLNLLKEIQSSEVAGNKKKKHKKKHKHKNKDKLDVEVHEIAQSDSLTDDNEASKDQNTGIKDEEKDGPTKQDSLHGDGKGKEQLSDERKSTKLKLSNNSKTTNSSKSKSEKGVLNQKGHKNDTCHTQSTENTNICYDSFTKKLETGEEIEHKSSSTKEMSYSEYLQRIENKGDDDEKETKTEEEEDMECEDIVFDDSNDNVVDTVCKGEEKTESSNNDRKKDISNFFKVMTSTPDGAKQGGKKTKHSTDIDSVEMDGSRKVLKSDVYNFVEKDESVVTVDCLVKKNNIKKINPLNGKGTQATLSFGKAGLTVSKPAIKKEETTEASSTDSLIQIKNDTDGKNVSTKPMKRKAGRPRKSRIDTIDLNTTDSSVFATPKVVRKKKVKRRKETSSDVDSESADSIDRRRSLRKRYKVEAFQMDADSETPIKIKLKRCPKSSSSGEDMDRPLIVRKQKTNMKQTAALALLDKAKRAKMKKKKFKNDKLGDIDKVKKRKLKKSRKTQNESNSSEDSVTRRSSRLEGRVMASMEEVSLENIVISSSDDEGNETLKVRKKGRAKKSGTKIDVNDLREKISRKGAKGSDSVEVCTPTKNKVKRINTPVKNSPKRSGVKMAPMFLKGKNKIDEASPKKPPLDPEQAKQRQQFLMSGVPDALRKQNAMRMASLVDADYPPFPEHNHVLQMPDKCDPVQPGLCNVWDLGNVELPQRCFDVSQTVHPMSRFTGDLMNSYQSTLNDLKHFKNFSSHEKLTSTIVDNCLKEIKSFNPLYPTEVMYKALVDMKTECERPPVKPESMLKTDMKGILAGCTDMVVIDDDEGEKEKKKKNLKLQKKEQKDQNINAKELVEKPKLGGCSMLWTEKYCPIKTSEILGNVTVVKKLKTWLTEWKHVLDREARKAKKLLLKKNKGKQLPSKKDADDFWDDDSDFDLDSDDSEDDDSLCNTMLLTGPHGCGKTSSVYALALELGFKVHEVNASSCRSGKQILSQLQEATQSHQVSTQGSLTPRKNAAPSDPPKVENKMPQSFTNLFKKAAQNSQDKLEGKDGGKKRKRRKSDKDGNPKSKKKLDSVKHKAVQLMIDDSSSQTAATCLNLSSTTLILFDEVDVVFDEDKGFLSAIQNFMSKTKIPIILTSADPGFTHVFDGKYEMMNLKRPSMASITTFLQTISLVENVRLEPDILLELVQLYNCDVRKCLNTLQFIVLSGGGHSQTQKSFQISNISKTALDRVGIDGDNSQTSFGLNTLCKPAAAVAVVDDNSKEADNSDDDFVAVKPLKKRRRVLDDESNSVDSCSKFSIAQPNNVVAGEVTELDSMSCSAVHCIGVETLFRNGNLSVADTLTQGLKSKSSLDLKDMVCTSCCVHRTTKSDVFYDNLHLFLPFSYKIVDTVFKVTRGVSIDSTKSRKRIKLISDLYDSEAANDSTGLYGATTEDKDSTTQDTEKNSPSSKAENLCLVNSLSCFTKLYDTLSCLDVLESKERMKIVDDMQSTLGMEVTGNLVPGVDNQLQSHGRFCESDMEMCEVYSSEIKARSVCKFYRDTEVTKQTVDTLSRTNSEFDENFVLPVKKQCEHFSLIDRSGICVPSDYRRACDNVRDHLPLLTHSHQRTRHLDYLPSLREICRLEQCRQISNTKRRFHHYLDGITLPLKDKTISTLATTFI